MLQCSEGGLDEFRFFFALGDAQKVGIDAFIFFLKILYLWW